MKKWLGLSFALLALGCMACAEENCAYDDDECIEQCIVDKCEGKSDFAALTCLAEAAEDCVDKSTIPSDVE